MAGRVENPEVCPSAAPERPLTQPGSLDYNPSWSQYVVVAVLGAKAVGQCLLPRPAMRDIGVHGASRAYANSCDQLLMRTENLEHEA